MICGQINAEIWLFMEKEVESEEQIAVEVRALSEKSRRIIEGMTPRSFSEKDLYDFAEKYLGRWDEEGNLK